VTPQFGTFRRLALLLSLILILSGCFGTTSEKKVRKLNKYVYIGMMSQIILKPLKPLSQPKHMGHPGLD